MSDPKNVSSLGTPLPTLALRAKTSRPAAVKLFCLDCMGHDRDKRPGPSIARDIRDCPSTTCALYTHRPYRGKP